MHWLNRTDAEYEKWAVTLHFNASWRKPKNDGAFFTCILQMAQNALPLSVALYLCLPCVMVGKTNPRMIQEVCLIYAQQSIRMIRTISHCCHCSMPIVYIRIVMLTKETKINSTLQWFFLLNVLLFFFHGESDGKQSIRILFFLSMGKAWKKSNFFGSVSGRIKTT